MKVGKNIFAACQITHHAQLWYTLQARQNIFKSSGGNLTPPWPPRPLRPPRPGLKWVRKKLGTILQYVSPGLFPDTFQFPRYCVPTLEYV